MKAIAARMMRLARRRPAFTGLAALLALTALEGTAPAANWLIIHKDAVQTVFVDKESIKHTPESVNAWIKGDVAAAVSKDRSVVGYESYYHLDCKARRYKVTETTFYYSDRSKETTRIADAAWKTTVDRVYFLYEYLCDQAK